MITHRLSSTVALSVAIIASALVSRPVFGGEAVSREITVTNDAPDLTFTEAISRAVTVANGGVPPEFREAISRAATVVRPLDSPIISEALSRAATVVRPLDTPLLAEVVSRAATLARPLGPPSNSEPISRAVTICDAGDLDGSGRLDLNDLNIFVNVLLGIDMDTIHIANSDLTCDGVANGQDIQPFVVALFGY